MRHLWSLLAGVIVAPLTWCLVALGQNGSQEQVGEWVSNRRFDTTDLIEPAVYLVVAGILLGLVATLRTSPLGPLVGGLLLVAPYVGIFISPLTVRGAVPDDWEVFDRHLPLTVPLDNGTLALIGLLLLMAVFSAQRWRRWPTTVAAARDETLTPEPVGEPVTVPGRSPEPETVSLSAKTMAEAIAAGKSPLPSRLTPAKSTRSSRTETPTGSPWSAPPGQGRPEKS
jgi:hypothetical protein